MDLNNVLSFGSKVDVLIRCGSAMTIGGKNYAAGQPYTYLTGVNAAISSNSHSGIITGQKGVMVSARENYLYSLVINDVHITEKIQNLFFSPCVNGISFTERVTLVNAETKLAHTPTYIYLYKNGELSDDYELDSDDFITITDFDSTANYLLFYTYNDNGFKSFIGMPFPYFIVEIHGKGNKNNISADFFISLQKCSLLPDSSLQFVDSELNGIKLSFAIIDSDKTVKIKI